MAAFYDPQGTLIDLKGVAWTLTDALTGCLVTGSTGGGKSSGPGALLRTTFLTPTRALPGGMGAMVLLAKNGEAREWIDAAKKAGRSRDIVHVTAGGPYTFNFLEWIASWGGGAERGPIPAVAMLEEIGSAADSSGSGSGDENAFFAGAFRNLLMNLVQLCQLARLPVSLPLMRAISSSAPQSLAQAGDTAWQQGSVCWHALREAEELTRGEAAASADLAECRKFFLFDFCTLSDKTKGVVMIMFTSLARPFLTRPLRPLFCEGTTITPEACFEGKIILVDIPVQEFHLVGKLAALTWKRAFQLAVMRRSGPPGTLRPVVLFADECQNFLSPKDTEYQAVARSAGGVTCFLTQQFSSIRDAMGSEDKAENLTANLQTKFFCQNTGETNAWASQLIGERYTQITNINVGRGGGLQAGVMAEASTNAGVSRHEEKRAWIEPSALQKLRRGGAANAYLVDAVVFCGGKLFADDRGEAQPYKLLSFRQR